MIINNSKRIHFSGCILVTLTILGCSGGSESESPKPTSSPSATASVSPVSPSPDPEESFIPTRVLMKVNQHGYQLDAPKLALVPDTGVQTFRVFNAADDTLAYEGSMSTAALWPASEDEVRKADFSALTTPGSYYVRVRGVADSAVFDVAHDIYMAPHDAALKAYYYNRASTALDSMYAGDWARALGHPDSEVFVHSSAATETRPERTVLSASKGWYDAGDYNKYVVNSGISTYTLLLALEHFPNFYNARSSNIPESSDSVPDILNEIMWNIAWLENMQDTDGGVYHKLTTKGFAGKVMPDQATAKRFVVQKTTAASLNFAAVMAYLSRTLEKFSEHYPGASQPYKEAAIQAWEWAVVNNDVAYMQPADIYTGAYDDTVFADEFAWAAAELFLATKDIKYLNQFFSQKQNPVVPYWGSVAALGFISLADSGRNLMSVEEYDAVTSALVALADDLLQKKANSAFDIPMTDADFVWGSNSTVMNQALMLLQAQRITNNAKYKDAAYAAVDYAFGRNATDYSFITGFGDKSPQHIHHRPSEADTVRAPVPGFLVGGPHAGQQDNCADYPSKLPAKSYLDAWCSYSTNEVTINWNAPLVYVLAALQSE